MAFDGIPYLDADFVSPVEYYPAQPATAEVLAKATQVAYYQARNASRIVLQQSFGFNHRNPSRAVGNAGFSINSTSFVLIAEAYSWIHTKATHIRVACLFATASAAAATAHLQVVATDGSTTVTGADETMDVVHGTNFGGSRWRPEELARRGYAHVMPADVSIKTLTLSADIKVTVKGYAEHTSSSTAQGYKPLHVSVWWEVRE